jgi:hypothetical protein
LFLLEELRQKGLKSVNAKMMMSVSIVERGFPVMAIIVGYEAQLTPFHGALSRVPRSHHLSHPRFFTTMIYPLSQLFSCNSPGPTQAEMLILKLDFNST